MSNIVLCTQNLPVAGALAQALQAGGSTVTLLENRCGTRALAYAALMPAVTRNDAAECVLISVAPAEPSRAEPLLQCSADAWRQGSDDTQFGLLAILQGLRDALAGRDCLVVLLGAALGLTGAANSVALATAMEGQRGMMKSLARQWGPQIRFIWLAVSTPLLFPQIAQGDLPEQCELGDYQPVLGRRPDWEDVARIALMLAADSRLAMTGQTLVVDGGEWMLP